MSDKIVRMPLPVRLTDKDLEIAEHACRRNAARCRRSGAIEEAASWGANRRQYGPRAVAAMSGSELKTLADLGDRHVKRVESHARSR